MKFAFIHIPKNAGKSFVANIEKHTGVQVAPNHKLMAPYFRLPLGNYAFYGGHTFYQALKEILPEDTMYFTLLRDPINRAYSHWQYLTSHKNFNLYGLGPPPPKFSEFIRHPKTKNLASNFQCRYLTVKPDPPGGEQRLLWQLGIEQQEIDLTGASALAIESLRTFEYVGLQDRFPEAVSAVCKIMGRDAPSGVTQVKRNYYDKISPKDLQLLMDNNQEDWAIYNAFK